MRFKKGDIIINKTHTMVSTVIGTKEDNQGIECYCFYSVGRASLSVRYVDLTYELVTDILREEESN
jgi:hypothetical protein